MGYDVWKTLYTNDFDTSKYLYHYTTIEKAIKILHSQTLRFASISSTNDTTESRMKLIYTDASNNELPKDDKRVKVVDDYFKTYYKLIRLICFSGDSPLTNKDKDKAQKLHVDHETDKYFDISGRGFALPRMWSQYASNNEGVCFIVNKEMFEIELKKKLEFFKHKPVKYKGFFDSHVIDEEKLNILYNRVKSHTNGSLTLLSQMSSDAKFLEYNFFTKLKDWENEREYRYVTFTNDANEHVEIGNIYSYLEGIVIGEKIDPAYESVIKMKVSSKCRVKKISFGNRSCILK